MSIQMKIAPSYVKCFLDDAFHAVPTLDHATCLRDEEFHFELIATALSPAGSQLGDIRSLSVDSPLADFISFARIEQVPVRVPAYPTRYDADYLSLRPGLFPDLLVPMSQSEMFEIPTGLITALYVTVKVPKDFPCGKYPITLTLCGAETDSAVFTLTVLNAALPKSKLIYTEWIQYDCIATHYSLDVFSEKHWEYVENYIKCAVANGINCILTPVFTPPLDTAVGGERPTVQLVDVTKNGDSYTFGFEKLRRFVALCDRCGAEYFEISHFFTQWGAKHAPKIMATVNGKEERIFGWDTDAVSDAYIGFLRAFLTAFLAEMKALGCDGRCIFHLSDEPNEKHLAQYMTLKEKLADLLCGYTVMDALSDFEFYKKGAVTHPIPASDRIEPFLEAKIEGLWTYYCCAQAVDVSNRFIAMPASRTRIIGTQLWKYNIAGFLQWGYNFWYTQYSRREINPYVTTEGACFTPAGDCFSVYPGKDGMPYESLHMKLFTEALADLRAMRLAEALCGRASVCAAIEADGEITFSSYPRRSDSAFSARERVNALIRKATEE